MSKENIVTIGGGTGSFMLLSGLKKYPINIAAIVSMADDGGSTGVLRDELGVLPPGDVRQCLVALSESSQIFRELMNYRFCEGKLEGHNFGNLFLSALEKVNKDFCKGILEAARILNVKGEVIPVTSQNMRLFAELNNGEILAGQKQLDHNEKVREIGIRNVFLKPKVRAYKKATDKILAADYIIIGPGDHWGSIVPNFLVSGIGQAIKRSKGKVIYNSNLTNKKGQTENFRLEDYISGIEKFIGRGRIDYVVFNEKKPSLELISRYEQREGKNSLVSCNIRERNSLVIIRADVLQNCSVKAKKGDRLANIRSFIRHDSDKLAKVLMNIIKSSKD